MARVGKDLFRRFFLDLLAAVHHQHAVGHLRHHAHVVGDEDHAHVHLVLQQADQLQDLRLDRHVQRRGRLVGDQERRLPRQRHRDHHSLAHAARELVRITVEHVTRLGDAHQLEHAQRFGPRLRRALALVLADRLGDLVARGEHRVQRGHRLLEDHRDIGAADAAHHPVGRAGQVEQVAAAAPERHAAVHDAPAAVLHQAHQRERGDRLARARLADDRQRLRAVHVERELTHGFHGALGRGETHRQAFDVDDALVGERDHAVGPRFGHRGAHLAFVASGRLNGRSPSAGHRRRARSRGTCLRC
jgi:hypothetical protein